MTGGNIAVPIHSLKGASGESTDVETEVTTALNITVVTGSPVYTF